ncbi:MAG: translation initiation factor IF-2 [Bdellovibrionaceae bacterium]|nr:translation initiation factor IF-2 [Pseudobdellovibrionaceae bacterium]
MTNPKVFEFAKEIGMTPLALMDKIREWQIPVKSHMAELEPEVLEQIKIKLKGGGEIEVEKPKKTAARKIAKKVSAPEADTSMKDAGKSQIVRRKSKDTDEEILPPAKPGGARIIKKAVAVDVPPVVEVKHEEPKNKPIFPEVVTAKQRTQDVVDVLKEVEVEKAVVVPTPVVEVKAPVLPPTPPLAPVAPTPQSQVGVARKKEVSVGSSGVSSTPQPRRNIIGRMDLSRVQAPQGGPPRTGGYQRDGGNQGAGGQGPRPPRPGGIQNRTLRAGFTAAPVIPTTEIYDDTNKGKKNLDKKNKRIEGTGGATAKEKEQEEQQNNFNAVEFRKREMVFQPKKKKGTLDREAMKTQLTTPKASKRILDVYGSMKLADASVQMGIKAPQLIRALMQSGVQANINTDLDFDTLALIVTEFGWEAQNVKRSAEDVLGEYAFGDLKAEPIVRPPVVTIMGHVDHGKTSLLDVIRKANVAQGEAGGITQHIGAYNVTLEDGKSITFLDTPGHEAFTAMRARGANATDVAVIVVAADDGLMPQTAEAINHAKSAGVPIIVAINKMDKPGANPDRIKQQLTEFELVPEEWGGTTIFCPVSALKKEGIKELLEQISLVAEMQDLKANPKRSATGIVIESKIEKGKGSVATLLIKDGTVKVGDHIVAGVVKGRVKSLTTDRGERRQSMGPGLPVEVLGLDDTAMAGDRFDVLQSEEQVEKVAGIRKEQAAVAANARKGKLSLEDIFAKVNRGDVKELAIILKTDVHGSLEAIQGMLGKLVSKEVKTRVLHAAVGGITESDVLLAQTSKGIIIGFNVRPDMGAQNKAKQLGIEIRSYTIVYELMDDIKKAMSGLLTPDIVEKVMGRAEVRNTFSVPKVGTIAGTFIIDGKIQRSNSVRLLREGKIIYEGKIASLKRFKDDAKEVAEGFECGIGIENYNDIKVGDQIEAFIKEEIRKELTLETNP